MAILLGVYVVSALAQRAQTRRVGAAGQHVLAGLRGAPVRRSSRRCRSRSSTSGPIGDLMSRLLSRRRHAQPALLAGPDAAARRAARRSSASSIAMLVAQLAARARLLHDHPGDAGRPPAFFAARARAAYRKTRQTVGRRHREPAGGDRRRAPGAGASTAPTSTSRSSATRNAANRDANVSAVGITSAFSPAIDMLVDAVDGAGHRLRRLARLRRAAHRRHAGRVPHLHAAVLPAGAAGGVGVHADRSRRWPAASASTPSSTRRASRPTRPTPSRSPTSKGASPSSTSRSPTTRRGRCSTTSASTWSRARPSRSSARPAPARRPSPALVPRFYDVDRGRACSSTAHDVRALTRKSLRKPIAMVLQEPFLFSGSIADNIAYGRPSRVARRGRGGGARRRRARLHRARCRGGYETRARRRRRHAQPGPAPAASPSRARCSPIRASSSSTRRPPTSTRAPRASSSARSARCSPAAPASSSPTG